jgi:hypothetical protein
VFDGRYLHCAPSQLVQPLGLPCAPAAKAGKRVTLLVNIWIAQKPLDCVRWQPPTVTIEPLLQLKWPTQPPAVPIVAVASGNGRGSVERVEMSLGGTKLMLVVNVDVEAVIQQPGSSVELHFPPDAVPPLCRLERKAKGKSKDKGKDRVGMGIALLCFSFKTA